ncbi:MAG TPA: hypothetical protein VIZ66_10975 [Sphingomicrobium sp.]
MRKFVIAAAAVAAAASPAFAQTQNGLVNVNLSDIQVQLQDILSHNNVNVQVPANVQLPIGIAAKICNVNVAALAQQKGEQTCPGSVANESTANAVARAVQHGQHQ